MRQQKACYLDDFLIGEVGKDRRSDSPLPNQTRCVIVSSLELITLVHGVDEAAPI